MPQNKKHHYVPRFYLKRFTPDERFINLYNLKAEKKIIGAQLKGQCYRNYFYGRDRPIESALSHIEGGASELMRNVDRYQMPPPPVTQDHYLMIVYLMSQRGRTIYASEAVNEMFDKMTKASLSDYFIEQKDIDISEFKIGIKNSANYSLSLSMQLYPLLFDMHYKLLLNKTSVEFITSDNPVVFYNQLFNFQITSSNCGLACKGLQIFFPLDSRKLIMLYDGATYRVGGNMPTIEITNPQDVYELNTLQMCAAAENVYFNDAAMNVHAVHRKARPFLRQSRIVVATTNVRKSFEGSEKLVGMSSEDIRTNLQVSVITLLKSAKKWREEFRKKMLQPVTVVRDQKMLDDFREFNDACETKKYNSSEFAKFLADKYGKKNDGTYQKAAS